MGKHFVRTMGAAMLIVGSLIVVAAQPACALRFYVHGNVHCSLMTGQAGFSPTLRSDVEQAERVKIKGTLGNCTDGHGNPGGETGIPGVHIIGGTFKVIADTSAATSTTSRRRRSRCRFAGFPDTGAKIRNTDVSWAAPIDASTEPYSYHFVGAKVDTIGVTGSYFGSTGAVSFISNTNAWLACAGGDFRGGFQLTRAGRPSWSSNRRPSSPVSTPTPRCSTRRTSASTSPARTSPPATRSPSRAAASR